MDAGYLKKVNLPDSPGVYFFLGPKKKILYIGKATSLKDRVKSYFGKNLMSTRGPLVTKMVEGAVFLDYKTTDSVLEALILEAYEIKKYKPIYNSKEKDDKSYNFVTITDEDFPRVVITRGLGTFGPFPHGAELKEALKIVRKIFPFRDEKCKLNGRPCFNAQLGLCPGPCIGLISKKDYRKQIRKLKLFFEAKKSELIKMLEKEMKIKAKEKKFEEANEIKKKIFALEHIQDMALIKRDIEREKDSSITRIEAYDIAHLSGKNTVGVMVVAEDGELVKSQYRKFKIKVDKNDDTNNLREIISRRLNHPEWELPKIIVVDGGVGQKNAAKDEIRKKDLDIQVVSVVKDERHKAREILGEKKTLEKWQNSILLANGEAHRFAISYHRKLRNKGFRI